MDRKKGEEFVECSALQSNFGVQLEPESSPVKVVDRAGHHDNSAKMIERCMKFDLFEERKNAGVQASFEQTLFPNVEVKHTGVQGGPWAKPRKRRVNGRATQTDSLPEQTVSETKWQLIVEGSFVAGVVPMRTRKETRLACRREPVLFQSSGTKSDELLDQDRPAADIFEGLLDECDCNEGNTLEAVEENVLQSGQCTLEEFEDEDNALEEHVHFDMRTPTSLADIAQKIAGSMQKADRGEEADPAKPPSMRVADWSQQITGVGELEDIARSLFDMVSASSSLSQRGFEHMAWISQQLPALHKKGMSFDLVDAFKGEVANKEISMASGG